MSSENIEERLKAKEESLIESMHSFVIFSGLSPLHIESFNLLLDNLYRHGLETATKTQGTNYSPERMIQRLHEELEIHKGGYS
jgi:organic radical activating enzyme